MNDDYLWDKSGKPDPEIQGLENILGTLRYQPRELEIPKLVQPRRRTFMMRGLAVAAAIALIALAIGVWTRMHKEPNAPVAVQLPQQVAPPITTPEKTADARTSDVLTTASNDGVPESISAPRRRSTSVNKRRLPTKSSQLSESELAQAKAAKEQLILALRVASSKLNLAQKRAQGTNDEIHNQHKTG